MQKRHVSPRVVAGLIVLATITSCNEPAETDDPSPASDGRVLVVFDEETFEIDAFVQLGAEEVTLDLTDASSHGLNPVFWILELELGRTWEEMERFLEDGVSIEELPDWVVSSGQANSIDLMRTSQTTRGLVIVAGSDRTVLPVAPIALFEAAESTTVSTLFSRRYASSSD